MQVHEICPESRVSQCGNDYSQMPLRHDTPDENQFKKSYT